MAMTITGTGVTFNDGTKFASTPTRGVHAGIRYVFSTTTDVSGTPGNGNIRFNNGTFGSITTITVAGTNADEQDFELFLDSIVDIDPVDDDMRGYLILVSNDDTANSSFNEAIFKVDGANTAKASGFVSLHVSPLSGTIFSNSESISLMFFPRGDRGAVGNPGATGPTGAQGVPGVSSPPPPPPPPDGGQDCLVYGMQVLLHNNTLINVENLRVGNYISISNQPNVYTRVEAVLINHIREGYYIVNNELMISNDHPVMTNYGKKKVEELKIGDFVGDNEVRSLVYNAGDVKTVSIITSAEDFNVYVNDKIYSVNGKYSTLLKPGEQKDEKLIA
jgi:hypothetical protein|tara:strand:+ start:2151 stop:3149 length:999 start_codon:yes stop_codon:yes gene_type:complete